MKPRERDSQVLFSLQGMNVTDYTLEPVKTVFVELFCSPKSSMENPSLRVSGHGMAAPAQPSSLKITLKMSMDNGLLTKQLSNKAKLMMKDRVFRHGTTTSMVGSPESFRIAKSKEEKVKAKVDSEELVRHTLVKNKLKTLSGGQKIVLGGQRVQEARKAPRKVRTTFLKVILVPIIQKRVQAKNITLTKEEVRIRREKEKTAPGTWTPCNDKEELGQ